MLQLLGLALAVGGVARRECRLERRRGVRREQRHDARTSAAIGTRPSAGSSAATTAMISPLRSRSAMSSMSPGRQASGTSSTVSCSITTRPSKSLPVRRVGRHEVDPVGALVHRVADHEERLRLVLLADQPGRLVAAADHERDLEPVVGGTPEVDRDGHAQHVVDGLGERREDAVGVARRSKASRPSQCVFGRRTHVLWVYGAASAGT